MRGPCESHTGGEEDLAADASGRANKKKRAVTSKKRAAIVAVIVVIVVDFNPALSEGGSDGRSRGADWPHVRFPSSDEAGWEG